MTIRITVMALQLTHGNTGNTSVTWQKRGRRGLSFQISSESSLGPFYFPYI